MPRDYKKHLDAINRQRLTASLSARDIASDFPKESDVDKKLRDSCADDLEKFLREYFPAAFPLPFCADHKTAIATLQNAIRHGGLFALAMPRSFGKTTTIERAAIWAAVYGYRRYIVPIGATMGLACDILDSIKTELSDNERLIRDFPHVCWPIRCLENNGRKAIGQLYGGAQTRIGWGSDYLILPTMPEDACYGAKNVSGTTFGAFGFTGSIRGLKRTLHTGEVIRPDLVIADDPQTRESAKSNMQCDDREEMIRGDMLRLSAGKKIAAVMLCTVIRDGDLSERFLDREKNPDWQGVRTKMVYKWPVAENLWDEYRKIRVDSLNKHRDIRLATAFYKKNRKAMDVGAEVAWPERYYEKELSAVQHAMNLRYEMGDPAFFAECQNEPMVAETDELPILKPDAIASKTNGIPRGIVPLQAHHLVEFVDVHDDLLYWVVAAFKDDFTGWVVDYGTYPDQRRRMFTLRKATATMGRLAPGAGREGAIRSGLDALAKLHLARDWPREDGSSVRIARCFVDTGYVPDVVYDFVGHSVHASVLMGSRGFGVGAKNRPMTEYSRKPAERFGWNWIIAPTAARGRTRYMRFDTNHWKSFLHARLSATHGDKASLSLFGRDPREHDNIAQHLTGERAVQVTANGRTVAEWSPRPQFENHWLDCMVGCCVAASLCGAKLEGASSQRVVRKRKSFAELQQEAQKRRAVTV